MWPAEKSLVRITLGFGVRYPRTPFFLSRGIGGKKHQGIDFAPIDKTQPVYLRAPVGGIVINTSLHPQYGYQVRIKSTESDRDYIHILAHMKAQPYVKKGDIVKKGTLLGIMGSSGLSTATHCHYEVRLPCSLDRIDPKVYLT